MTNELKTLCATLGVSVEAAATIIEAAVSHAERGLNLEYNSPAGRMSCEEAERALWLVRDFALADEPEHEIDGFNPYADDEKDWRDE